MKVSRLVAQVLVVALLVLSGESAFAIDNLRIAYPSMNTSVFAATS